MSDAARHPCGLTLAIEASNPSAGKGAGGFVALGRCAKVSKFAWDVSVLGSQALGARWAGECGLTLVEAIDLLVRNVGATRSEIERVAVSAGPGGFTSVRVSVATAAALAEALGARCVAAPTAEVVARSVAWQGPGSVRRAAIALAGKRDGAWAAVYEAPVRVDEPPYVVWKVDPVGAIWKLDDFAAEHERRPIDALVADEHLPEAVRAWAQGAGVRVQQPVFSAVACFEASLAREAVDAEQLRPIYPREPEAVSKWRSRGCAS